MRPLPQRPKTPFWKRPKQIKVVSHWFWKHRLQDNHRPHSGRRFWILLPDSPYCMSVMHDEDLQNITSFLQMPCSRIKITVGISWNTLSKAVSFHNTGPRWKLVNKTFQGLIRRKTKNLIMALVLRMAICKVIEMEGILIHFISIGSLSAWAWFRMVDHLGVGVLTGILLIDRCKSTKGN